MNIITVIIIYFSIFFVMNENYFGIYSEVKYGLDSLGPGLNERIVYREQPVTHEHGTNRAQIV